MILIILVGTFLTAVVVFWYAQTWLTRRFARYRTAFKADAREGLGEVFLFLDPSQVWLAGIVIWVITTLGAYLLTSSAMFAGVTGVFAVLMPRHMLSRLRARRLHRLDRQLPDLLLGLAGALRAGAGIQSALRHIAEHTPTPLSQELSLMLREQRMGVAFEDALAGLHSRIPTEGASLVVSALKIASHSGGHLAETLERIAATLRARLHLIGRVRALTSQGRMQAWVMACLPPGLAFVLYWLDPDAMAALWTTPSGWAVVMLIVILETVGIFLIRKIVTIDV